MTNGEAFDEALSAVIVLGDLSPEHQKRVANDDMQFAEMRRELDDHKLLAAVLDSVELMAPNPRARRMAAVELGMRIGLQLARVKTGMGDFADVV